MCGITGCFTSAPDGKGELSFVVSRMSDQLVHRGPDDCGIWVDQEAGVALGHRRLAILDLSADGHQPMHSESGRYVIVFNGEVYNFEELRCELEPAGHCLRGRSDTEVMLAAMEEWGLEHALTRFNGMFALAVWDRKVRRLELARDRLGEKPLYYGWMGKSFLFGSELKALAVHPDFTAEIDRNSLAMYLKYSCVPATRSIYRGIRKLPPGTRVTLRLSEPGSLPQPVSYWSAAEVTRRGLDDPYRGSAECAIAELDELLRDAIKMRMVADVPLGAFLSGGVDSSAIVALMQRLSASPVKTFSIGFRESAHNEAENAAAVAHHLGTEHREFYVSPEEAMQVIPKLPSIYDEPFADSSQIPTHIVARLARQHVTVSLSGDGGDELFGGYKRYFTWGNLFEKVAWLPWSVRRTAARGLRSLSAAQWNDFASHLCSIAGVDFLGDKLHRLGNLMAAEDTTSRYEAIVSACEAPNSLVLGGETEEFPAHRRFVEADSADFRQQMMFLDTVSYLPDDILVKVDRATMAVALEARVPYLDHRIVEFAARLPLQLKIYRGRSKWILRRVLHRYVPKELIERPKKGFSLPIGSWLRGPLREWAEDLLTENRLNREGFFNARAVGTLWKEHLSAQRDLEHPIWSILMFQAWLAEWGKAIAPTAESPIIRELVGSNVRAFEGQAIC
jgi:asparagine synthase (glutamine-hydrolysing)